jgi:hypothetical protein
MLVRRGLPAVIELGVQSDEAGGLRAHAWLTSYDAVLLGGNGHQNFRRLQAITTLGVAGVER